MIEVKDCNNCPFRVDEDDTENGLIIYCNLAEFKRIPELSILKASGFKEYENLPPSWCPIKEGNIEIQLEEINK